MITCEEEKARVDAESTVEFMTTFFEMLSVWMLQIPEHSGYYQYMQKYPYLYLVCPQAAVLNLSKSFITSLELIFGISLRSEEFLETSSIILGSNSQLPQAKYGNLSNVSKNTNSQIIGSTIFHGGIYKHKVLVKHETTIGVIAGWSSN